MKDQLQLIFAKFRQYPVAISAFCVALFFLVIFFARGGRFDRLEAELEEKERRWERVEDNLRNARDLESQIKRIRKVNESSADRVMNHTEIAINYDYFYQLEAKTGVRITNLSQGGIVDPSSKNVEGLPVMKVYSAIRFSISLEGAYEEIIAFVSELEKGYYFTRISSINVTRSRKNGPTEVGSLQIQILGEHVET